MAPRPKLSKPIRELICKYVGLGVSMQAAAAEAGIGSSTFYSWLKRGREAMRRAEAEAHFAANEDPSDSKNGYADPAKLVPERERPYVTLVESIEQALGHAEVGFTLKIARGAEHDWKAAAWWLERRASQSYGNRSELRIEREPQGMSNDELIAELSELGFVQVPVVEAPTALAFGRPIPRPTEGVVRASTEGDDR